MKKIAGFFLYPVLLFIVTSILKEF